MIQTSPLELGLACGDVESQIELYTSAFDFAVVQRATVPGRMSAQLGLADAEIDFVWLQGPGGERIKLFPTGAGVRGDDPPKHFSDRRGFSYLTFYCADLDATLGKAEAAGCTRSSDPALRNPDFDTRISFLRDREGNAIELVERKDLENYRSDLAGWPRKREQE